MKYFFFVAAAVMLVGGFAGISEMPQLGTAMLFIGGWCLFKGVKNAQNNGRRLALSDDAESERAAMLQESYDKAVGDYKAIETARRAIGDIELSNDLAAMQQVSGKLLRYLEKNPDRIPLARKFIDYYQDRAAHLATKYAELEETGVNTADIADMKERTKAALSQMNNAYAEQFTAVLNDRLIDMDAELKVLNQTLSQDGVTTKGKRPTVLGKPGEAIGVLPAKNPPPLRRNDAALSIIPPAKHSDVVLTKVIQSSLAIFLGGFGAHKFYQGKTLQGVLYIVFCWTAIPSFIGFCEGLRYLFMKLDAFYLDYYEKRT